MLLFAGMEFYLNLTCAKYLYTWLFFLKNIVYGTNQTIFTRITQFLPPESQICVGLITHCMFIHSALIW